MCVGAASEVCAREEVRTHHRGGGWLLALVRSRSQQGNQLEAHHRYERRGNLGLESTRLHTQAKGYTHARAHANTHTRTHAHFVLFFNRLYYSFFFLTIIHIFTITFFLFVNFFFFSSFQYGCLGDLGMHVVHLPLRFGWQPQNVRAMFSKIVPDRPSGTGDGKRVPCETWYVTLWMAR